MGNIIPRIGCHSSFPSRAPLGDPESMNRVENTGRNKPPPPPSSFPSLGNNICNSSRRQFHNVRQSLAQRPIFSLPICLTNRLILPAAPLAPASQRVNPFNETEADCNAGGRRALFRPLIYLLLIHLQHGDFFKQAHPKSGFSRVISSWLTFELTLLENSPGSIRSTRFESAELAPRAWMFEYEFE